MLRIDKLSKRYRDYQLFQELSYSFSPGCFALCEEDSTGKSSLLRIIAGVIAPDGGDVWIDGHSLRRTPQLAKARVAYVPDNCMEFPTQTGIGMLQQVAAEKNTVLDDSVLDLAYRLGLEPHLEKRFEQMSTGTRRKVYLTAAALGDPAVIIADGPSSGLDTPARAALAEQFKTWAKTRVVLFASHDYELVQACEAQSVDLAGTITSARP
ncbi:ATP-binding cassette domain-containing protein [Alcaligenaceae bacterium]|nr:ATP-binding cassette domain-containing protein [Alcaligenaceae bacterium]